MKRKSYSIIAVILAVCILTLNPIQTFAISNDNSPIVSAQTVQNILASYQQNMQAASCSADSTRKRKAIQDDTVATLKALGIEAYGVDRDSYDALEKELATDFSDMGMSREYSYILMLGDAVLESSSYWGNPGASFTHVYNGTTYTMRFSTLTAADAPALRKLGTATLRYSPQSQTLQSFLNSSLYASVASSNSFLGTIQTLSGLHLNDLSSSMALNLTFTGGSNWTRIFTQVKDVLGDWTCGSFVEYVTATGSISGTYFDVSTNQYQMVPSSQRSVTRYSPHCTDLNWRKNYGVLAHLSGYTYYDLTGDVTYKLEGSTLFTHAASY